MRCDLQTYDALDRYRTMLANIEIVIKEQNVSNVVLAGDCNADPFKGRFQKELLGFMQSISLLLVDEVLPDDSFTYLCPAKNITSWLDHVLCNKEMLKYTLYE